MLLMLFQISSRSKSRKNSAFINFKVAYCCHSDIDLLNTATC